MDWVTAALYVAGGASFVFARVLALGWEVQELAQRDGLPPLVERPLLVGWYRLEALSGSRGGAIFAALVDAVTWPVSGFLLAAFTLASAARARE